MVVLFSDHGERLFDNGLSDDDFGHGFPAVSRQEIDVPFFMWLSSTYQQAYPSAMQRLKSNARSPAELSNLFETVTDLTESTTRIGLPRGACSCTTSMSSAAAATGTWYYKLNIFG
ncbi:MAG: sulfatase-like hydrolase/transferase [Steroidobacteraceae bacterium]|jgi:glucan phosphoethanolaminetransferase (alkaline phosphatase superfamily)